MTRGRRGWVGVLAAAGVAVASTQADAQALGTFRWQLEPFCNVVSLTITPVAGGYRLEGTDDQCGSGADLASATGMAFPNPDGTIGFGLTIVATPGGAPVHVDAAIVAGGVNGTWSDSAGNKGPFTFTPGPRSGGSARPVPLPAVPTAIQLLPSGSFVAGGSPGTPIPATGAGDRFMWHAGKAALRAGIATGQEWDDAQVGRGSAAFGSNSQASGLYAFAAGANNRAAGESSATIGAFNVATGLASVALGYQGKSSGYGAVAAGFEATAGGDSSVAIGDRADTTPLTGLATAQGAVAVGSNAAARTDRAVAVGFEAQARGYGSVALGGAHTAGNFSTAAGRAVFAAGPYSIVLGTNAETTAAARGSIVFGDNSPNAQPVGFQSFRPNEFLVRAAGGIGFFTKGDLTTGVYVPPGGTAWSSLSDVNAKEHFRELDHSDILAKVAAMPVREWSYKAQDASIRHIGPTAQDFRAAFGLGEDPLRISTLDADGVALAAIRALEARDRAETERLRAEVTKLSSDLAEVRAQLAEMLTRQR